MKIAYVNVQAIAANSATARWRTPRVNALVQKKQAEAPKQKTPQDQQRFQQARRPKCRAAANCRASFEKLARSQQMAQEKHLSMLLSAADAGLIWADPAST